MRRLFRMKSTLVICSAGLGLICSCNAPNKTHEDSQMNNRNVQRVESLKEIPVDGAMIGPAKGLSPNATTHAVVEQGGAIIPTLLSALDTSSWSQTVWIMFCLKEMKATEAKARVLKLLEEIHQGRFSNEPRDLTLETLIRGYFAVIQ